MKLAAVISELPKLSSRKSYDQKFYVLFKDRHTMEKEFRNQNVWGIWASYKFPGEFEGEAQYRSFQDRYEALCAGFLRYYDDVVRSGAIDHTIGFKWPEFKRKGMYELDIYLSPAPLRAIKKSSNSNGFNQGSTHGGAEVEAVIADSPDVNAAVDPPKPPPPPPPEM